MAISNIIEMEGFDLYATGALETVSYGKWFQTGTITQDVSTVNPRNNSKCSVSDSGYRSNYRTYAVGRANANTFQLVHIAGQYRGVVGGGGNNQGFFLSGFTSGIASFGFETTTGKIQLYIDNTQVYLSTFTIPVNVWASLEFGYNSSTGAWVFIVNGRVVATGTSSLNGYIGEYGFTRIAGFGPSSPANNAWDDLFIYSRDDGLNFVGDTAINYGLPNADQAAQDWTPSVGGDGFAMIDNVPPNLSQYIEASTASDISRFTIPDLSTGIFQVHGVGLTYLAERTNVTPFDMHGFLTIGGADYDGETIQPPQSSQQIFTDYWIENPATASNWTPSDISNLIVGFERDT